GQTCPDDLIALSRRGVRVFSIANLHAKAYVFNNMASIGSANASRHSAEVLIEAMAVTSDVRTVKKVRRFVQSMCKVIYELGLEQLKGLRHIYRPPRFSPNTRRRARRSRRSLSGMPAL